MPDFDEQWKKVMGKEYFENNTDQFGLTKKNIEKFKKLTGMDNSNSHNSLSGKICLDVGCGIGR